MKKILLLAICFISLSCSAQNLKLVDPKDMSKNYGVFNDFVDKYEVLKTIENRSGYTIYEENGHFYLQGNGKDKKSNNVVFRIKFKEFESNTLSTALEGESCTGVNCEECAFKKGGGCECKRGVGAFGVGSCNHTVTR